MARDAPSTTRSIGTTTLLEAGTVINMKTVEELLNYLEPEYKEKALKNAENYGCLKQRVPSISEAINGFSWCSSPEGDPYWAQLYHKYHDLEEKGISYEKS